MKQRSKANRMKSNSIRYNELARAKVQLNRSLVISECSKGGYTIAQQLEVKEEKHTMNVFLKGALHIDDLQGLYNLRDALNVAIEKQEKE